MSFVLGYSCASIQAKAIAAVTKQIPNAPPQNAEHTVPGLRGSATQEPKEPGHNGYKDNCASHQAQDNKNVLSNSKRGLLRQSTDQFRCASHSRVFQRMRFWPVPQTWRHGQLRLQFDCRPTKDREASRHRYGVVPFAAGAPGMVGIPFGIDGMPCGMEGMPFGIEDMLAAAFLTDVPSWPQIACSEVFFVLAICDRLVWFPFTSKIPCLPVDSAEVMLAVSPLAAGNVEIAFF
jgi:hypothetical protein